jgi:hypothetical protein
VPGTVRSVVIFLMNLAHHLVSALCGVVVGCQEHGTVTKLQGNPDALVWDLVCLDVRGCYCSRIARGHSWMVSRLGHWFGSRVLDALYANLELSSHGKGSADADQVGAPSQRNKATDIPIIQFCRCDTSTRTHCSNVENASSLLALHQEPWPKVINGEKTSPGVAV